MDLTDMMDMNWKLYRSNGNPVLKCYIEGSSFSKQEDLMENPD